MKETRRSGIGWGLLISLLIVLGFGSLTLFYIIPFIFIQTDWIPLGDLKSFFFKSEGAINNNDQSNSEIIGTLGTVGDWFGGTTLPVLTFLSYIGVMIAIIMQRQELGLQRKELQETRDVFIIQRFENTFFNMITLNNDIITNIKIDIGKISNKSSHSPSSGRDSFSDLYTELLSTFSGKGKDRKEVLEEIINSYELFFSAYQDSIGHYFRNLYRITKFIHENEALSMDQKQNYIGILRAQLSTYELLLIFYNALSDYGSEKFLPLIKKYNLFDNINNTLLINQKLDWELYKNFEETKINLLKNEFEDSLILALYNSTAKGQISGAINKISELGSVPKDKKINCLNDISDMIKVLIESDCVLSDYQIKLLNSILIYIENYGKELGLKDDKSKKFLHKLKLQ
ncbi:hypothetical protein WQ54_19415 [Bacillus sp. SA1-12]|uniref:putative phage abortive infection protein n=1 Tax=Bacillus sp. SA1-12 TaxID=1455638 RepID=UPI000626FF9D|nr:putative phage abortive infection protein [Bacillus sp. SA1-12]KKI90690.1 hypothetical protein WQ54_19415 [Bacillus sp. SA1-12]